MVGVFTPPSYGSIESGGWLQHRDHLPLVVNATVVHATGDHATSTNMQQHALGCMVCAILSVRRRRAGTQWLLLLQLLFPGSGHILYSGYCCATHNGVYCCGGLVLLQ